MNYLIGIIIAILLGAIITAASLSFIGSAFTDNTVKAEALALLNEIDTINNGMTLYRTFNHSLTVGFSDPNNDGDYSDSEIFRALEEEGYIKNTSAMINTGGYFLDKTTMAFSKIIEDENLCLQVNHERNAHPVEGLVVGAVLRGYGTIMAEDLVGKFPKCGSGLGNNSVCCVKE